MTDLSPAATLTAAADKLRDLIGRAVHEDRTTWSTAHTLGSKSPVVVDDPEKPSVLIETYAARLEAVNQYIAAMDPGVGTALTDWLDHVARHHHPIQHPGQASTECRCGDDAHPCADSVPALAVARRILGEQP